MLRIIKDMNNKVKTCVRGCNSYSDIFDCAVGLKQGEVISPMLFSFLLKIWNYFCKMTSALAYH